MFLFYDQVICWWHLDEVSELEGGGHLHQADVELLVAPGVVGVGQRPADQPPLLGPVRPWRDCFNFNMETTALNGCFGKMLKVWKRSCNHLIMYPLQILMVYPSQLSVSMSILLPPTGGGCGPPPPRRTAARRGRPGSGPPSPPTRSPGCCRRRSGRSRPGSSAATPDTSHVTRHT